MLRRRSPLLLALGLVATLAIAEIVSGSGSPRAGRAAPRLPTSVLVAPRVTLTALRGKPALINFWASWCGPCEREAPQLRAFARSLRGRARLVGVNWVDSLGGARAFIHRARWTFPNLRDGDGTVGNAYGIAGLPTTFVLNAQGRIVATLHGPQTRASLTKSLQSANP
jgi:cytochrome c biogenesis protein CcmG, thiol:disulfide interchange protein DsbE